MEKIEYKIKKGEFYSALLIALAFIFIELSFFAGLFMEINKISSNSAQLLIYFVPVLIFFLILLFSLTITLFLAFSSLKKIFTPQPHLIIDDEGINHKSIGVGKILWNDIDLIYFHHSIYLIMSDAKQNMYLKNPPLLTKKINKWIHSHDNKPIQLRFWNIKTNPKQAYEQMVKRWELKTGKKHPPLNAKIINLNKWEIKIENFEGVKFVEPRPVIKINNGGTKFIESFYNSPFFDTAITFSKGLHAMLRQPKKGILKYNLEIIKKDGRDMVYFNAPEKILPELIGDLANYGPTQPEMLFLSKKPIINMEELDGLADDNLLTLVSFNRKKLTAEDWNKVNKTLDKFILIGFIFEGFFWFITKQLSKKHIHEKLTNIAAENNLTLSI